MRSTARRPAPRASALRAGKRTPGRSTYAGRAAGASSRRLLMEKLAVRRGAAAVDAVALVRRDSRTGCDRERVVVVDDGVARDAHLGARNGGVDARPAVERDHVVHQVDV